MQNVQKSRKVWVGYWLLAIAVLHTIYAAIFFGPVYADIVQRGIINTVGRDPITGAAVWFAIFGVMMAMLAAAITPMERSGQHQGLRNVGLGLLLLCVVGVALMPTSGFWLGFPAALALILKPQA
jgi:Family of unknown function (DUF6463)